MTKTTYSEILEIIRQELINALFNVGDTVTKNILDDLLTSLNESTTPLMEIKKFTTNAEFIQDDTTLQDLVKFIRKHTKTGNLNYLINMAKEEHIEKLRQMNIPSPEKTLSELQEYLNVQTDNEIIKLLKQGMYDSIQSDIVDDLKSIYLEDFKSSKNRITKDQQAVMTDGYLFENGDVSIYSPIGLKVEDVKNDKTYILTENDIIEYDRLTESYSALGRDDIHIIGNPEYYSKIMGAINQLQYDVDSDCFTPNMIWDFNVLIDNLGKISVWKEENNKHFITSDELRGLFKESLLNYKQQNKGDYKYYVNDADNMMLLVENHNKLVKFDTLKVIRNLNESNNYAIIKSNLESPEIISLHTHKDLKTNQKFNSYKKLNESLSNDILIHHNSLDKLFESKYKNEIEFEIVNQNAINKLLEEQSEINKDIETNKNLLAMAEVDSPAFNKLNESLEILNRKLNQNLSDLKEHKQLTIYG